MQWTRFILLPFSPLNTSNPLWTRTVSFPRASTAQQTSLPAESPGRDAVPRGDRQLCQGLASAGRPRLLQLEEVAGKGRKADAVADAPQPPAPSGLPDRCSVQGPHPVSLSAPATAATCYRNSSTYSGCSQARDFRNRLSKATSDRSASPAIPARATSGHSRNAAATCAAGCSATCPSAVS